MGGLIKIAIFSLILSILLYPGLEKLYLYRQTNILEDLVMAPLSFLGENQTILSNDDKFTRYGTVYKSLDLARGSDLFIGIKNEFKFHEIWVNLTSERDRVFEEKLDIDKEKIAKLRNGKYSMIVYGPFTQESDIYYWIYGLKQLAKESEKDSIVLDNYCELFLPSTEHKCILCKDINRVFFRDNQTCSSLTSNVIKHYKNNFYKICGFDELYANTRLKMILLANGFFIRDKCENGGRLLTYYNDKTINFNYLIQFIYLSLIITTFLLLRNKRRFMIFILILVLSSLPFLYTFDKVYTSDYYRNESAYAYFKFNQDLPKEFKVFEKSFSAKEKKTASIGTLQNKLNFTRYGGNF